jgi:beta-barrel assembly-enhancing protease
LNTHLLLGALLSLSGIQGTFSSESINFFSTKQDIEIGTDSAEEAERQLDLIRDPRVVQYVRSIAQKLVQHTPSRQFRYRFQLVNTNEVSSLGFPNGTVYIYRGLLSMAANDDEVAAIIAHEIAHIASRHPTSQLSRQLLVQAPISISAGLSTAAEWKDQLTKLGVVFGVHAPFLHYSPDLEVEAIDGATQLLMAARFDPSALDTVFQKIVEAGKKTDTPVPIFLYNHRIPEHAASESDIEMPKALPHDRGFRAFRAALDKVPAPVMEGEPAGAPSAGALPNLFTHPFYQIHYPSGWQVTTTLPNGAVIAAPNSIRTSTAGDDLMHGVMFDIFPVPAEKPLSLEQATNRLIVHLRQRNQTVRAVPGAQTPTLIHDAPGLRTVLLRGAWIRSGNANVNERSEVLWLVTRMYYQNLFYMIFVAPEDEFATHQAEFEQMIRSVQIR